MTEAAAAPRYEDILSVKAIERMFLSQVRTYEESELSVHDRWSLILMQIPALRGRRLYEDLTDIYTTLEQTATGARLYAALDLACLQMRLWSVLGLNSRVLEHTLQYELSNLTLWQQRLGIRLETTRSMRIKKGKVRPAVLPPVNVRHYLN